VQPAHGREAGWGVGMVVRGKYVEGVSGVGVAMIRRWTRCYSHMMLCHPWGAASHIHSGLARRATITHVDSPL